MTQAFEQAADAMLARGDVAGALAQLEKGLAGGPVGFPTWMKVAALRRRLGNVPGALVAANGALDAKPNDFLALLLKGALHEQLSDPARAREVYQAAVYHAPDRATLPPALLTQLDHAQAFVSQYRKAASAQLSFEGAVDPEHRTRAERFLDNVLDRRPIFHMDPTHYYYPGLADIEYFDFAYPELLERLRQATPDIQAELQGLIERHSERQEPYVNFASGQPMGQFAPLNRNPDWNAFHLIRYGELDPINSAACPRTMEALSGPYQPDVPGLAPNLMFSLLAPHTRIPPHTGVANFRCLLHLPLIVPPGCAFRVGADTRPWVAGEPWLFDDSIEHEAWNESDELRVILIADVWKPQLDPQDKDVIRAAMRGIELPQGLGAL